MFNSEFSTVTLPKSKKLLVLDLDNTLCDLYLEDYVQVRGAKVIRPYLHSFLTTAYKCYNIVIWSATDKKTLDSKLIALNVVSNNNYKILFTLNQSDMIVAKTMTGLVRVKPLALIWKKCSEYCETNTLMVDDLATNFYLNPRNGLQIKPYFQSEYNTDNELELLTKYVVHIAKHSTHFEKLNHKLWKEYLVKNNL